MLTPILKTRTLAGFVLAYVLCGLMLLFGFFNRETEPLGADMLFSHWAFSWFHNHEYLLGFLGVGLLAVTAVLSRLRPGETKLAFGSGNLSMIVLVAIAIVQDKALFARPNALVATMVSIAAFLLLGSTHKKESVLSDIFHVGLLLAISSLFVGQAIFLLLPIAFSFLILRPGSWKEWAALFIGIAMCSVFVMSYSIWHESPVLELQRIIQSSWSSNLGQDNVNGGHLALLIALFVSVAGIFGSLTIGTVTERNLVLSNTAWIVSVILMVLLLSLGWQQGLLLAAFPLSVSAARAIERIERWWLADLLLLTVLCAPFAKSL
jgi:hypothetical protein